MVLRIIKVYKQKYGIDYTETFAPVVRYESERIVLAAATHLGLKLIQFDVKCAFIYASLTDTIYMKQPEGFDDGSGRICKLLKSIYGLKQSPLNWYETLSQFLIDLKFKQSEYEPCLFYNNSKRLYLLIYVDDGLLWYQEEIEMEMLISKIHEKFQITVSNGTKYICDGRPRG